MVDLKNYYTQDDVDFYKFRTKNHIDRVQFWANKIDEAFNLENKLNLIARKHDLSKWKQPEYEPYILITKNYREMNEKGVNLILPEKVKNEMFLASFHHITNNPHHPEYWDQNGSLNNLNKNDRDSIPNKIVNAETMPFIYIYEMCADWLAVAEENQNTALKWANMNIGKRWKFTPTQTYTIYKVLEKFEK